jgi:UTP--glucose-1-phosphate uridylyltransferase
MTRILTAVFPVAGRGTRFLPVTKASPKEMLPIVDKPLIQYAAEEALRAGAEKLVFITGSAKRAIEDHFDTDHELEQELAAQGKLELLETLRGIIPSYASCIYVRQPAPLGLGHAVLCSRPVVGDEPFFVHLADDLIAAEQPCLKQLANVFEARRCSVIGVETVPPEETAKYGIVAVKSIGGRLSRIEQIVEKPKPQDAPSNLGVVGRYLLTPAIYDKLERTGRGAGGEIQLTDGISALLADETVYAYAFEGKRYDCGSKLGYLEATVEYALKHPSLSEDFSQFLARLVADRLRSAALATQAAPSTITEFRKSA